MKKAGILGLAHGHVNAFCGEWIKHAEYGVQVAGAWDHDAARLESQAQKLGAKPYRSLDELLASDIDAAVICSGKPVLRQTVWICRSVRSVVRKGPKR